jgi:alpha-amylase
MRLATYEHLIAAEDLAETAAGRLHAAERRDLDLDGHEDIRLAGPGQVVTIHPTEGAGIGGWDIRAVRHALCAVMRRRPEAYHETLRRHEADVTARADAAAHADGPPGGAEASVAPASIHETVMTREAGLADRLHYDPYERRSGLVRFLDPETDADAWATSRATELGDAVEGAFDVVALELDRVVVGRDATVETPDGPVAVRVTKEVVLGGDRRSPTLSLSVTVANRSDWTIEALLGLEWTLTMLGGGGNPAAWLEVAGIRGAHDARGSAASVSALAQGNDQVGVAVATTLSKPGGVWWAPVETVSNSEGGFERIYQGAGILSWWPLSLQPGATWTVTLDHVVTTARDAAEDEAAAVASHETT